MTGEAELIAKIEEEQKEARGIAAAGAEKGKGFWAACGCGPRADEAGQASSDEEGAHAHPSEQHHDHSHHEEGADEHHHHHEEGEGRFLVEGYSREAKAAR